jgi:hypothetical protein
MPYQNGGVGIIMKKFHLFKIMVLSIVFAGLLFIAGCSGSDNTLDSSANVVVQLTSGTNPYLVDQMTVSIQKSGGSVLTGVTNAQGVATITVTETGDYNVIQVAGVDATNLAESSDAGREFIKANPLVDPYPNLTHTVTGVTVSVVNPDTDYNVNVAVPFINKVTVLKVGSAASDDSGSVTVTVGTAAFTGRVMISNLNCSDNRAALQIVSSDANANRLHMYMNITAGHPTPEITDTKFYGGPSSTMTDTGFVNSYTQAGPIYFEAPGTNSGDWALGYNLSATDMKTRGSADVTLNFPAFNGGAGHYVLGTWSTSGGSGHTYSFDYRIFQFNQL